MTTKFLSVTKYAVFIAVFFISLVACEKNFKDIGIALVDNNKFDTNKLVSPVISYNKKIDSVRVDSLPEYLLGVYNNNALGKFTADIITQISIPGGDVIFGDNAIVDSVLLDIPYYNTSDGKINIINPNSTSSTDSILIPTFTLDSIIGDQTKPFKITVSELGTFLNDLNPIDPTKRNKFYSNKNYSVLSPELYSGDFTPSKNDTISYIKHRDLNGDVFDIDTIRRVNSIPSIKLPLNEQFFQDRFISKGGSDVFSSQEAFTHYFRGLYIKATGNDGTLLTLPIGNGKISIFFSNDVTATDDSGVTTTTRTKHTMSFGLFGIKSNKYTHDYSVATSSIQSKILSPDKVNGEDRLYIQGAAGSIAILDLFTQDDIESIRSKNWLINEASLKLYVDKNISSSNLPSRLFIYNYDDNAHLRDIISSGAALLDGTLHYDDNNDPSYYKFRITDYISDVLKSENPKKLSKLAIKSYSSFDIPRFTRLSDTIVKPFNWNPKGVAVYGNKELSDKKLSLDIYYTELKN